MQHRIDAETLRKRLLQYGEPDLAERFKAEADEVEGNRVALECSLSGVVTLFTLARLDQVVAGMPDAVELRMLTGSAYLWGRREGDGTWRLWGNPEAYRNALSLGMGKPHQSCFARQVLAALAVPDSPGARHELLATASWAREPAQLANAFAGVAGQLPRHVVVAALRYGIDLMRGLDIPQERANLDEILYGLRLPKRIHGAHPPRVHFDDVPTAGMEPALHGAVERRDGILLQSLVHRGANVDVPSSIGETPLMRAAAMGDQYMVDLLLDRSPDAAHLSDEARTVLHSAAEAIVAGSADNPESFLRQFVEAGADPGVRDMHGLTAADILREAAAEARGRDKGTGKRFGIPFDVLDSLAASLEAGADDHAGRP